jgi:hypothetical protein
MKNLRDMFKKKNGSSMKKDRENVFILILEKGVASPDGISFNEIIEYLIDKKGIKLSENLRFSLGYWFLENFVTVINSTNESFSIFKGLGHSDPIPKSILDKRFEEKRYLYGDTYMSYLDYVELEQAKKSAKSATWIAIIAIIISMILTVVQIFSNNK